MDVSSINFKNSSSYKTNSLSKNKNMTNVNFCGKNDYERNLPSGEQCVVYFHPVFELQKQLLEDGYTLDEISKHQIFDVIDIDDKFFPDTDLEEKVYDKMITKEDIFHYSSKKLDDVKALQKAYILLKLHFDSQDIQEHLVDVNQFEEQMAMFSKMKGLNASNKTTIKSMILNVLHYVDRNNVDLLQELLNDMNFNNVFLSTSLMKLDNKKDMKYAHETLKMAQEMGYDKEFSHPLAIMLSEAEKSNMPIIEKMLNEQEFLIRNEDFITSKMMPFLRDWEPALAQAYLIDETMTLNEVDELME